MAVVKPPPKKKPPAGAPAADSPAGAQAAKSPATTNPLSKPAPKPGQAANPLAKPKAPTAAPAAPAPGIAPKPAFKPLVSSGPPPAQHQQQPSQGSSDDPIEKKVLALLSAGKKRKDPALFHDFIEKICPKIQVAGTTRGILQAFSSPDVTSDKVAEVLRSNPYYEQQFMKVVASMMSGRDELPKLEASIVMMGMQNSRNTVLAMQLVRTVRGTHPEWSKEGKIKLAPKEILKYALKTEDAQSDSKESNSDIAYAAGMLFDVLALIASDLTENDKRVAGYIENVYAHGLRSAKVGWELSKKVPDFSYKKFAFAGCLIHDVGKVIMAILEPTYLDFLEEIGKHEMPRAVRLFSEEEQFGIHHAIMGAVCAYYFRIFRPIEKAILFHHEPYMLKETNRNLYQLASLIALSTNIANNFKKVEKPEDPIVRRWKTLELKDFRFDVKDMMAAVAKST